MRLAARLRSVGDVNTVSGQAVSKQSGLPAPVHGDGAAPAQRGEIAADVPHAYSEAVFGKKVLFYLVASMVIAFVVQALGADIGMVLIASLVGPPLILLALAVLRYWGLQ